jgi:cryptochrome 1
MGSLKQIEGYRFDPKGDYVRRWLPELSRLPTEWIHHPWDAPPGALRAAGIELGINYPRPIVDIGTARERLQASLAEMWEREEAIKASSPCDMEETIEVAGTGGLMHGRMHVHRVLVHKEREVSSNSSRRDQLVPNMPTQSQLDAHASIMHKNTPVTEDFVEESPPPTTSQTEAVRAESPATLVVWHNVQVPAVGHPFAWPNATAVDFDLDSTADSSFASGRSESAGGTVPVWSQSHTRQTVHRLSEGLVPVVPEMRRGILSRRHVHASVQSES